MRKFLAPFLLLLCACAAPPVSPPAPAPAAPAPSTGPAEAWDVVESSLQVRVYRDGSMAQLGHNHLITTNGLTGRIDLREPRAASGFRLELPLGSLVVDDAAARAAAGGDFAASVPAKDRDGTRRNLLGGEVLDAARQPVVVLSADTISGGPDTYTARVRVALRGEERLIDVPLMLEETDGERLLVHASLRLRHADLGLVPFTVAMGALRVRDDFELDCRLEARRAP
ncbi:MAG TPA: hypothetical protein VML92_10105 [Steroidobacteraceae bacterium]|nr:hypothetical protein [Steroidobacteraceae bacterium]